MQQLWGAYGLEKYDLTTSINFRGTGCMGEETSRWSVATHARQHHCIAALVKPVPAISKLLVGDRQTDRRTLPFLN